MYSLLTPGSYKALPTSVKVGSIILIADGSLSVRVTEIKENSVIGIVLNDAEIGERKNMNLPKCNVDLPTITEKDKDDIVNFGVKHNVDMIALSFARSAADVNNCRALFGEKGKHIKIISKIENHEGMEAYDEILAVHCLLTIGLRWHHGGKRRHGNGDRFGEGLPSSEADDREGPCGR